MPTLKISRWIEALKNLPLVLFVLFSFNHGINIFISPVAPRQNYFLHLIFYLLFAYLLLFGNFVMCRERIASATAKKISTENLTTFKLIAYMTVIATVLMLINIAYPILMSLPDLTDLYAYFVFASCFALGIMALWSTTILRHRKLISAIYLRFYSGFNLLALFLICLTTSKIFLW